jgi:hypothetical protein
MQGRGNDWPWLESQLIWHKSLPGVNLFYLKPKLITSIDSRALISFSLGIRWQHEFLASKDTYRYRLSNINCIWIIVWYWLNQWVVRSISVFYSIPCCTVMKSSSESWLGHFFFFNNLTSLIGDSAIPFWNCSHGVIKWVCLPYLVTWWAAFIQVMSLRRAHMR